MDMRIARRNADGDSRMRALAFYSNVQGNPKEIIIIERWSKVDNKKFCCALQTLSGSAKGQL